MRDLETLSLKGVSPSCHLPQDSRNPATEEEERMLAPERMEETEKARPPKSAEHLHKNLQRLRQRALGLHGSAPDTLPRVEKRRGHMPPSLIQEASPTDNN